MAQAPAAVRPPITPIILAGGQGTRLWPLSRAEHPKQFLALHDAVSLFQETLQRADATPNCAAPVIVTHADYRFLVAEQARALGIAPAAILLEPQARNTALAINAATLYAKDRLGAALVHILPSDHAVNPDADYLASVDMARGASKAGALVTFGIAPTAPETGYGYILPGAPLPGGAHAVAGFQEKPDAPTAQNLVADGRYLWNSGMFLFPVDTLIEETAYWAPDVADAADKAVAQCHDDLDFVRLGANPYAEAPSISIDHAVMERSDKIAVIAAHFPWSDLGSWDAVWKSRTHDEAGNAQQGKVVLANTRNSLVVSEQPTIVVDGLEGIGVVASEDAVYVAPLDRAQAVGGLVKALAADPQTASLTQTHRTAYRPWGGYTSLVEGPRFQVKRIFVDPGKRLSLQRHHHRAEHWVVVTGSAEVTLEDEVKLITENESIFIPLGCAHRLANPGKIRLELIEVQTGAYLGEDDIVRLDDVYGRL